MRNAIKRLLSLVGLEVRLKRKVETTKYYYQSAEMTTALERLRPLISNDIYTFVDVGAAVGDWSLCAKQFWPNAKFVLCEPLAERAAVLDNLCNSNKDFYFLPVAAGKEEGEIQFSVTDDLDGSGSAEGLDSKTGNIRTVAVKRIDEELRRLDLTGPYIIKLDTHGFEVPIIEGCQDILKEVSLFIIECYGLRLTKNSLLFWEMCEYMDKKGFGLIDIIDITRRPIDNAFWQCDAFFIPKTSPQFSVNTFKI